MRRRIIYSLLAALLMQCVLPYASAQSCEVSDEVPREAQSANLSTENTSEGGLSARPDQMRQNWSGCQRAPGKRTRGRRRRAQHDDEAEDSRAMWRPSRSRRHALIGAIIGFGIGAAIGAKGDHDQDTRARVTAPLLGGAIGALIGAAIGGTHP